MREGKGNKDRVTVLPENLIVPLQAHLQKTKALHDKDVQAGLGRVYLPHALAVKYPQADRNWAWQYVFPSPVRSMDPRPDARTGQAMERRHHVYPESVQRAVREAARLAGWTSRSRQTCFAILLPRICCRRGTTFAPCTNCWVTLMSARQ